MIQARKPHTDQELGRPRVQALRRLVDQEMIVLLKVTLRHVEDYSASRAGNPGRRDLGGLRRERPLPAAIREFLESPQVAAEGVRRAHAVDHSDHFGLNALEIAVRAALKRASSL